MKQYLDLLKDVLENGNLRSDRTGTGTYGVFGRQLRFDLQEGFPLVTTKKIYFKAVVAELLWFLRGDTNIKWLNDNGVHIWDQWAAKDGDLGPIYGSMWRRWPVQAEDGTATYTDQIAELVNGLRNNPFSRRHIVSGWNPALLPVENWPHERNVAAGLQALPPCHTLFQMHVEEREDGLKYLSCQLYQRSADLFLGVPFNIASYALLTQLIANHLGYQVGEFIWTGGDCHIYSNHLGQVYEQQKREPHQLPNVHLRHYPETPLENVEIDDIVLEDYVSHPAISAPVAV